MRTSLRSFGIGLFLAGAVLTVGEKFDVPFLTNNDEQSVSSYKKQIRELEDQLNSLEKGNPIEQSFEEENTTTEAEPQVSDAQPTKTVSSDDTTDVREATIYVYDGMSLYDIGEQVEDLGIVENGRQVELYLSKPEYSRSVQKGAFDLRSDMTLEEIAKTITGKKLN
ncbi:hypothetical protein [Solibacillus sp. FSL H8-0538]|uniref:hypothetical protein n=1 Tax=Solibacillus sp. FSL H8-0538 TaxID=2921400 RepID=UPI0030F900F9